MRFTVVNLTHTETVKGLGNRAARVLMDATALGVDTMITRIRILALSLAFGLTATAAWAEFKIERALTLEPGGTFILESDIGDVALTGESVSGARVVVTSDEDLDRDFDFTFDDSGRTVTVKIKRRGTMRRLFGNWFDDDDTRITIQVPRRSDVRLSTSGGSIRAQSRNRPGRRALVRRQSRRRGHRGQR